MRKPATPPGKCYATFQFPQDARFERGRRTAHRQLTQHGVQKLLGFRLSFIGVVHDWLEAYRHSRTRPLDLRISSSAARARRMSVLILVNDAPSLSAISWYGRASKGDSTSALRWCCGR